jgi:hypothetical protein
VIGKLILKVMITPKKCRNGNFWCIFWSILACIYPTDLVTKVKPNISSIEVHPQLSNNRHPMDGVLVGVGSLWPQHLFCDKFPWPWDKYDFYKGFFNFEGKILELLNLDHRLECCKNIIG